jgi:hypothetical protein
VDRITRVATTCGASGSTSCRNSCNVLRGDMNLVGPRPHPVTNQASLHGEDRLLRPAFDGAPGVTGWAQIRYGYANNLAEETEKMRYDLYYIKNRSLWLDLRILLMTVATVLLRQGRPKCTAGARRFDRRSHGSRHGVPPWRRREPTRSVRVMNPALQRSRWGAPSEWRGPACATRRRAWRPQTAAASGRARRAADAAFYALVASRSCCCCRRRHGFPF